MIASFLSLREWKNIQNETFPRSLQIIEQAWTVDNMYFTAPRVHGLAGPSHGRSRKWYEYQFALG
jgi:hypothetical protein